MTRTPEQIALTAQRRSETFAKKRRAREAAEMWHENLPADVREATERIGHLYRSLRMEGVPLDHIPDILRLLQSEK